MTNCKSSKNINHIINSLETQRILVIGLAETGLSYANYFANKKVPLIFSDDNKCPKKLNQIKRYFTNNYKPYVIGKITKNFKEKVIRYYVIVCSLNPST